MVYGLLVDAEDPRINSFYMESLYECVMCIQNSSFKGDGGTMLENHSAGNKDSSTTPCLNNGNMQNNPFRFCLQSNSVCSPEYGKEMFKSALLLYKSYS